MRIAGGSNAGIEVAASLSRDLHLGQAKLFTTLLHSVQRKLISLRVLLSYGLGVPVRGALVVSGPSPLLEAVADLVNR